MLISRPDFRSISLDHESLTLEFQPGHELQLPVRPQSTTATSCATNGIDERVELVLNALGKGRRKHSQCKSRSSSIRHC